MGMHQNLNKQLRRFLENQKVFFVATAAQEGRINLSPKGLDSLKVLNAERLIWLNLTGSGNETAAHLLQNSRITIMACSFDDKPLILRVYGEGLSVHPGDEEWEELFEHFPNHPGARQIIDIKVDSVQTSCGSGVPLMNFVSERAELNEWADRLGEEGIRDYWQKENLKTIDGIETGMEEILDARG